MFIAVILKSCGQNQIAGSSDIGLWSAGDPSDRRKLLPYVLGEEPDLIGTPMLPSSSPLHGKSKSELLVILGPEDESGADFIGYYLGNLTINNFENLVVPQNASVRFVFKMEFA